MNRNSLRAERLSRRAFVKNGSLLLAAGAASSASTLLAGSDEQPPPVRFGLVTDLHYADKVAAGSRHYRETPAKLAEAAAMFSRNKPDFIVELGDFIDSADSVVQELNHLKRINKDFTNICPERHYVLGNHCVHTLTKQEFLDTVEKPASYYSFDSGEFHFVVLDACFRSDGEAYGRKNFEWTDPNVTEKELEWLQEDLKVTTKKTVVFAHQRLDVSNHYGVKNAKDVRAALEKSGQVLAVFQGHSHKNDYVEIGGIHYCTLVAMVEGSGVDNSGFSVVEIQTNGTIHVDGFRQQADYDWKA